jgi:hypothetical protein
MIPLNNLVRVMFTTSVWLSIENKSLVPNLHYKTFQK